MPDVADRSKQRDARTDFSDVLKGMVHEKPEQQTTSAQDPAQDDAADEPRPDIAADAPPTEEPSRTNLNATADQAEVNRQAEQAAGAPQTHARPVTSSEVAFSASSEFRARSETAVDATRPGVTAAATTHPTVASALVNGAAYRSEPTQAARSEGSRSDVNSVTKSLQFGSTEHVGHRSTNANLAFVGNDRAEPQSGGAAPTGTNARPISEAGLESNRSATRSEATMVAPQIASNAHPASQSRSGAPFDAFTTVSPRSDAPARSSGPQVLTPQSVTVDGQNSSTPGMRPDASVEGPRASSYPTRSEQLNLRAAEQTPIQGAQKQPILTAAPPATASVLPSAGAVKLEQSSLQPADVIDEFAWDMRPQTTSTSTSAQIQPIPRHELPGHIAQQLAQAMHRNPDRPVEIALNPAELGRVRMTFTTTDTGIVVNILADRPETLDLMRRNIGELGESFQDLGYDDIAFAFGGNGDPSDTSADTQSDNPNALTLDLEPHENATPDHPDTPRLAILAEGIDLRL